MTIAVDMGRKATKTKKKKKKKNLMPLKYVSDDIMEHGAFGANAPFSIIFSKVFKTLLIFLEFFQCCLKIENYVII